MNNEDFIAASNAAHRGQPQAAPTAQRDGNMTTTQHGNVTRVTIGAPTAPQGSQAAPEPLRVHQGALQMSTFTGEVTQGGVTKYSIGQDAPVHTSVAQSLQRVNGRDTVCLQPGVEGSRTHVETAIREGLLRRTGNGTFEDVNAAVGSGLNAQGRSAPVQAQADAQEQQQVREQQQATAEANAIYEPSQSAAWDQMIAPLNQSDHDVATAGLIAAMTTGQGSPEAQARVAHRLAADAGMEVDQAAAIVEAGRSLHTQAVGRAVLPLLGSIERVQDFLSDLTERPTGRDLHEALEGIIYRRDPSKFQALAQAYDTAKPGPQVAALRAAGFETARHGQSGWVAKMPGGEWRTVADIMKG